MLIRIAIGMLSQYFLNVSRVFSTSFPTDAGFNAVSSRRKAPPHRPFNDDEQNRWEFRWNAEPHFAPRLRLIETAEISLPGDWIEIDCWLLRVLTASIAEKIGLLARRLIWLPLEVPEMVPMAPRLTSLQVPEIAPSLWLTLLCSSNL